MPDKPKILLFIKDIAQRELISDILSEEKCHVFVAEDFYEAIEALALNKVVGAVICIDEGRDEGVRLIRLIDENVMNVSIISVHNKAPISLLTEAHKAGSHESRCLSLSKSELQMVFRGLKKRIRDRGKSLIEIGNLVVDKTDETFYINRMQLELSTVESRLLLELAKRRNEILTMEVIKKITFFDCDIPSNRKIYSLLGGIKAKLEKAGLRRANIENIKGEGYALRVPCEEAMLRQAKLSSANSS